MRIARVLLALIPSIGLAQPVAVRAHSAVAGRLDPGDAVRPPRLVFSVQPPGGKPPLIRLLGDAPHQDPRPLDPRFDAASGLYQLEVPLSPRTSEGRLQIELPGELHSVALALRAISPSRPTSCSSVEGTFEVVTLPAGIPAAARLSIASLELPLGPLPPGAQPADVLSVHAVGFSGAPDAAPEGWRVTVGDNRPGAPPATLWFMPRDRPSWTQLKSTLLPRHGLVTARFAGPGTYLLSREVGP